MEAHKTEADVRTIASGQLDFQSLRQHNLLGILLS